MVQQRRHGQIQAAHAHQIVHTPGLLPELANGYQRAIQRQRWDDGIQAATARQTGIHHGRGFIQAPP